MLVAALLHAAWNAVVKASPDKHVDTVLVVASAALASALTLPFVPLPAAESWPFLLGSVALHLAYFALLAAAYRAGDLSHVYPLMRGTAPLLTAAAAGVLLGEPPGASGWAGVLLVSAGILLLAASAWRRGAIWVRPTTLALANAAVISLYTLVDGSGTRRSGSALAYVGWLLLLTGATLLAYALLRRGPARFTLAGPRLGRLVAGGACTWASYAIALWAMTRAPVARVAALRETSVVFGALLAALLLGERLGALRWVAALLVCAGAAALRG